MPDHIPGAHRVRLLALVQIAHQRPVFIMLPKYWNGSGGTGSGTGSGAIAATSTSATGTGSAALRTGAASCTTGRCLANIALRCRGGPFDRRQQGLDIGARRGRRLRHTGSSGLRDLGMVRLANQTAAVMVKASAESSGSDAWGRGCHVIPRR